MFSKQLQIPGWNEEVWSQILLWSKSCHSWDDNALLKILPKEEAYKVQGWGNPAKSKSSNPSCLIELFQYSTRRTGFYQLTFSKWFHSHSSFHIKDVFPVNPAPDLFFLWISQLSSISVQTFKWNDFAVSRRTKFPLIPAIPLMNRSLKKSLTTGTRWLSTMWVWWVITTSPA